MFSGMDRSYGLEFLRRTITLWEPPIETLARQEAMARIFEPRRAQDQVQRLPDFPAKMLAE